jgi:putative transcriptional regulator
MVNPGSTDLLISPPVMGDRRFRNAVLMLTHLQNAGTYALCLNKPTQYTLQDIVEEVGISADSCAMNFPLYWGGPVSPTTIWMLHTSEWSAEGTVELVNGWSMTSNVSMFHHLADGDAPQQFRVFYGFCAWTQGQLAAELAGSPPWNHKNSWLVASNPGAEWLFEHPVDELWDAATELSAQQAVATWL